MVHAKLLTDAAVKCTGSTLHVALDASLLRASLKSTCAPAAFNGMSTLACRKNRQTLSFTLTLGTGGCRQPRMLDSPAEQHVRKYVENGHDDELGRQHGV